MADPILLDQPKNTLIANATALRRLAVPDISAVNMPAVAPPPPAPFTPPPALPASPAVSVVKQPNQAAQNTQSRLLGDQTELKRLKDTGSGISQISNPFLRGLAKTGEIAESIIAPGAAALTPGTEMHNRYLQRIQQGNINNELSNQQAIAQEGQTEANTNYLNQRPQIEQSKIDQKETAVRDRVNQAAAAHGQKVAYDENGIPSFTDDYESQAFHDRQALSAMHQATADKNKIVAEIQQNHYIPGTPEYQEAQRKLAQVDQRLNVSMSSLGLRAQGLDLRRQNTNAALYGTDNAGNALPGSAQIAGDDGQMTTVGAKFAPHAISQQKAVGSFNDLSGSVGHTRNALTQFFNEGGSLSDPRIVAAMSDPHSTIGKVINGKVVTNGLSPAAITAINSVRQLHEQAGILRSTTGGTSSEAGAQRILDVVPSAGDNNAMALSKLDQQEEVLKRLAPGMTGVSGGVKVKHQGQPGNSGGGQKFTVNGRTFNIPADKVAEFKRDHPDAR